MSEWKPCPFCGSTALRIDKCTKRVKCQKCYATGGFITPFVNQGMTEDEAMKATWNRRYGCDEQAHVE